MRRCGDQRRIMHYLELVVGPTDPAGLVGGGAHSRRNAVEVGLRERPHGQHAHRRRGQVQPDGHARLQRLDRSAPRGRDRSQHPEPGQGDGGVEQRTRAAPVAHETSFVKGRPVDARQSDCRQRQHHPQEPGHECERELKVEVVQSEPARWRGDLGENVCPRVSLTEKNRQWACGVDVRGAGGGGRGTGDGPRTAMSVQDLRSAQSCPGHL